MLRVVIAGGPCSGKTKIAEILEKKGYFVLHEAATEIIKEQKASGGNLLPDKKPKELQLECLRRQIENEKKIPKHAKIVFYETSTIDPIAYFKYWNLVPSREAIESAKKIKYDIVFLMDLLPYFEQNGIRFGNSEIASQIHKIIKETYKNMDYKTISIPPLNPEERVKMIEKIIKKKWGNKILFIS